MKICVVGAGAIGGILAARFAHAGFATSVIARGAHLAAIRQRGLIHVGAAMHPFAIRMAAIQVAAIRVAAAQASSSSPSPPEVLSSRTSAGPRHVAPLPRSPASASRPAS